MKKSIFLFLTLVMSAGVAASVQAKTLLVGDDQMSCLIEKLTNPTGAAFLAMDTLTMGLGCGNIVYVGNGAEPGQSRACSGQQMIVPSSRPFNASVCESSSCTALDASYNPEGIALAADFIPLLRNSDNNDATSCLDLAGNGLETLRLLYAGADGSGSAPACDAQDRRDLTSGFSSLFTDCDNSRHGCADGVRHAYRLGDNSGVTSIFKDLVGITNFCNGNQNQDNDPIRRTCSNQEMVCGPDGTMGLVLPIFIDKSTKFSMEEVNNDTRCAFSKFRWATPPFEDRHNCPYGPPLLADDYAGVCLYPVDSQGRFGCKAGTGPFFRPSISGGDPDFDPRTFNLIPRAFDGRNIRVSNFGRAFYRGAEGCIHGNESEAMQAACMVEKLPCTVGLGDGLAHEQYSSKPTNTVASARILGEDVNSPGYPLLYKLFLNALAGFSHPDTLRSSDSERFIECVQSEVQHGTLGGQTLLQHAADQCGLISLDSAQAQTPDAALETCP